MKKRLLYILPLVLVPFFLLLGQFHCTSRDEGGIFGSPGESPLKKNSGNKACEMQDAFREIYDLYKDRVVFIATEQYVRVQPNPFFDDPFMRQFFGGSNRSRVEKRSGLGSGFIISDDGYICTNQHVVEGMDRVFVKVDGKSFEAKIVGTDRRTDIALLKINPGYKLKPVYFGDSDQVRVGDWAVAIGNPFGLDKTFTVGVVSAIGRRDVDMMGGSHIQTDASINPGNSGGPLINIYGEVIGINRMIYSQSGGYMGIGFAIPVNTARSILAQLREHKKIKRGYIGVTIMSLDDEQAKQLGFDSSSGAFVSEVVPGGPAEKGGVQVGDLIRRINDRDIKDYRDLLDAVSSVPSGNNIKVMIIRGGKTINLYITVAGRPD